MNVIRLLPFDISDGPRNMAVDHVILDTAANEGLATLRFYGWSGATVSLGYFQAARVRLEDSQRARLPWVRRPSGGKLLVHHHELTYALAVPPGYESGWMTRMHQRVILPALDSLGLGEAIRAATTSTGAAETLCFLQQAPGDLVCNGHKVVGSAQRKHHRALLQHGAILLATSEFAPELPGLQELTGKALDVQRLQQALADCLAQETRCRIRAETLATGEGLAVRATVAAVYGTPAWNEKR